MEGRQQWWSAFRDSEDQYRLEAKSRCEKLALFLSFVIFFLSACSVPDISSPAQTDGAAPQPTVPVSADRDKASYAVEVDQGLAYLGIGSTLQILDVTNPVGVRPLGLLELPSVIRHLDKLGDQLGVACGESGLILIDVSEPASPRILGTFSTEDRAEGIALAKDRAYVAARTDGVRIFETSDPTNIQELGQFESVEEAFDVVVVEKTMYVAASFADLRAVDITDPTNPIEIGFADRGSYDQGYAWGVSVDGNFAYVANVEIGLRVVDIQNPYEPRTEAIYPLVNAPVALAARDNLVFIADQQEGLHIIDVSNPTRPARVSTLKLPGRALDIVLGGSHAFVAAREGGLRIVDIANPAHPREIGRYVTAEDVVDLAILDNTLVAADRLRGLRLFDLSGTGLTELAGADSGVATVVAIGRGQVLAGDETNLIRCFKRSADQALIPEGQLRPKGEIRGIQGLPDGSFLVVGDIGLARLVPSPRGDLRLQEELPIEEILEDSLRDWRGSSPALVPTLWGIAVESSFGFLASDPGLIVLDLSKPGNFNRMSVFPTPQRVFRVTVEDNLAFLACDDGLRVLDVSDPREPKLIHYWKSASFLTSVSTYNRNILVTDLQDGLVILRIGESGVVEPIARVELEARPVAMAHSSGRVYVATGLGGIETWDIRTPSEPGRNGPHKP